MDSESFREIQNARSFRRKRNINGLGKNRQRVQRLEGTHHNIDSVILFPPSFNSEKYTTQNVWVNRHTQSMRQVYKNITAKDPQFPGNDEVRRYRNKLRIQVSSRKRVSTAYDHSGGRSWRAALKRSDPEPGQSSVCYGDAWNILFPK